MNSKYRKLNYKTLLIVLIISSIFIFSLRVVNLDKDLPSWGISTYQPIDEGLYSRMALNKFNNLSVHMLDDFEVYTSPHLRNNIFPNIIQYISLKFLGDNYYGFRMPSILFSISIFILFILTMIEFWKNFEKKKKSIIVSIALGGILLTDFMFLISSRTVEPSISRCAFIMLAYYTFIKLRKYEFLRNFLLSFIISFSVFFVYVTNIFMFFSCFLILLTTLINKDKKKLVKIFLAYLIGFIVAFILSEIYYRSKWDISTINNMVESVKNFSVRPGYNVFDQHTNALSNLKSFFISNIFFYNIGLLIGTIVAIIINMYTAVKKRNIECVFTIGIIIGLILQTIVSVDYIQRKSIIILPILLLNILMSFYNSKDFLEKFCVIKSYKKMLGIFLVFFNCLILLFYMYNFRVSNSTIKDFEKNDIYLLISTSIIEIITALIFIIEVICINKEYKYKGLLKKILSSTFLSCIILCNLYFSNKYVYFYRSYNEKNIMKNLGEEYDNNIIMGSYIYGYTLYNNIRPLMATIDKYNEYIANENIHYYFDYADLNNTEYMNNSMFYGEEWGVQLYKEYKREFYVSGKTRNIGVFEKYKKN